MTLQAVSGRPDLDRLVASGAAVAIAVGRQGDEPSSESLRTAEAVAARLPEVQFATMDFDACQEVAALLGLDSAPALVLFRAGVGLYAGAARLTEAQLEAMLRRALALDMDEVRRDMDRDRAAMRAAAGARACPTSLRGEFPPGA